MHWFFMRIASYLKVSKDTQSEQCAHKSLSVFYCFKEEREACCSEDSCGWPCLGDPVKGLGRLLEVSGGLQAISTCVSFPLTVSGKASWALPDSRLHNPQHCSLIWLQFHGVWSGGLWLTSQLFERVLSVLVTEFIVWALSKIIC